MIWTALVPVKAQGEQKTRLSKVLTQSERSRLTGVLTTHVLNVLKGCSGLADIIVLSSAPPEGWTGMWIQDTKRGLNAEVSIVARSLSEKGLLIIHSDLPFLQVADIDIFLRSAGEHCAIAPDRNGTGTNALALPVAANFPFSFGPDSFNRHCAVTKGKMSVVKRAGLAFDLDTPDDLADALEAGWRY